MIFLKLRSLIYRSKSYRFIINFISNTKLKTPKPYAFGVFKILYFLQNYSLQFSRSFKENRFKITFA